MRKWYIPVFGMLFLAACQDHQPTAPSIAHPVAPQASFNGANVPDEYIVVFKGNVSDVPGLARQLVASHGGQLLNVYTAALKGFALRAPAAAISRLKSVPTIDYIEPNQYVYAVGEQLGATWGIDRVDQLDLPLSLTYNYDATGAGVHAYIIDTGINITHTEFGGRASVGFDALGGNGIDCNGHGTHVAGTVGGTTYGMAKAVTLHAVRVLNCSGSGTTNQVIAGIDWVTANHIKPAVANMSLGGSASSSQDQAVRNSIAAGVTYALAAGNGNLFGQPINACNTSPARVTEALTVGATDINDAEAYFSNYGTCVDLLAPGVNITSAWTGSDVAINIISGTSMAAPHVAGTAALYLSKKTTATPAMVASSLLGNAVANTITLHASSAANATPNLFLLSRPKNRL